MSEKMIVRHCAPTLAGLKTGTIFNCEYHSDVEINEWLRDINRRLSKKGLRVVPLKKKNGRVMIYVYRPMKLKSDISQKDAAELLERHGYVYEMPARCIVRLIERLATSEEFPHEIGLFLGYPPEDVKGFIENGANGAKCVGKWKVYGDVEQAKKTFSLYRKCTDIYLRHYENGHMSVVIVGGNECMVREYINLCRNYNCRAKVFCKMRDGLGSKVGSPELMILFTNTTSHKMVKYALSEVKGRDTKIERCHSSSLSALRGILDKHMQEGLLCPKK